MKNTNEQRTASIWQLTKHLKDYFWPTFFTFIFLFLGRVASSFDPIWLKKIIDGVQKGETINQIAIIVLIYFGLRLAAIICDLLRDVIFAVPEIGIPKTLSVKLFSHLLNLQMGFHNDQKVGALSRKIARGSRSITMLLDIIVINILPTFVELIIVTVLLLKLYSPYYALVTFMTVIVYTWFTIWSTEKRQKYRLGANIAEDDVSGFETDALFNIDTVKYFNSEKAMVKRYHPLIQKWFDLSVISNKIFALVSGVQGLILTVGLGIILYLAIGQTLDQTLTIGDLVLLSTYVVRLSAPISVLGFVYRRLKDGLADLEGMAGILAEDVEIKESANPKTIDNPEGQVIFNDVSFSYQSNRKIYQNLDFKVEPGQKVALVGPSGVGKSTIVKLLFRLFEPTAGQILIDGIDLKDLSKDCRHDLFAIVPQEPALFNTTIEENIRFGKPNASMAEIIAAAKIAHIDEHVESLPEKYQTIVGERGVKLSGGEKQRVAIARAIVRNPKILVFDEATSSLDSKSERSILEALKDAAKGRTTIAVAHRLSTITDSDVIFVLDKGKIVEQGSHNDLLKKNGLYARLWKIQSSHKQ